MPTVDGFGGAGGLGSGVTLSEGTVPSVGDGLGASLGSSEPDADSSSDPLSLGDSLSSCEPLSLGASELLSLVGELVLSEGSSSESPVQAVRPPSSSPTVRMWAAVRAFVRVTLPVACPPHHGAERPRCQAPGGFVRKP